MHARVNVVCSLNVTRHQISTGSNAHVKCMLTINDNETACQVQHEKSTSDAAHHTVEPVIKTFFKKKSTLKIHRVTEKKQHLFLLELRQISTNLNKFW